MIGVPSHAIMFADYEGTEPIRNELFGALAEFLELNNIKCIRCARFIDSVYDEHFDCVFIRKNFFTVFLDHEFESFQVYEASQKHLVVELANPDCFGKILEVVNV